MRSLQLMIVTSMACAACSAETAHQADDADGSEEVDPASSQPDGPSTARELELDCVSGATVEEGELVPSVWRVTASVRAGTALVVLGRSPQFRSHAGVWSSGGDTFVVDAVSIEEGAFLSLESDTYPPTTLELEREGSFFAGAFDRGDATGALLCWDTLEVFGSPWAQRPKVFPAHFDAAVGACVDSAGAVAQNELPIAFVRETGFGECADLSDVALNDGDFSYPELALNLRGALLDGATLHFANLSASLEGARMRKLVFGYSRITGSIDASTELPIGSACSVVESPWAGNQVTCMQ